MTASSTLLARAVDGAVIVFSILLAFTIDAAWQSHQETVEEQQVLRTLRDEFVANERRVDGQIAFHSAMRSRAEAVLNAAATSGAELEADTVDKLIVDLTWFGGFTQLASASLDAVIAGGKLDLIQNKDLVKQLTEWRRSVGEGESTEAQEFANFHDVLMPFLRANTNLAQISNAPQQTIPGSEEPHYGNKVPVPTARMDHRGLLGNMAFLNVVTEKLWVEDDNLYMYGLLKPKTHQLVEALEREIGQ